MSKADTLNVEGVKEKIHVYQLLNKGKSTLDWKDSKSKRKINPKGEEDIKLVDIIRDPREDSPTKGKNVTICYVPGEGSIYLKDQIDTDVKKDTIGYLNVVGHYAFVKDSDEAMVDFLDASYLSSENKDRPPHRKPMMKKLIAKDINKGKMDAEATLWRAKSWAFDTKWEEIERYALAYDIVLEGRDPESVRYNISQTVNQDNASQFLTRIGSKETKALALVQRCIDEKTISVDRMARKIVYTGTQEILIKYPAGQKAKEALAGFILEPRGQSTFESLESTLAMSDRARTSDDTPEILPADVLSFEASEAVELGIHEGLVAQDSGGVYRFDNIKCGKEIPTVVDHFDNKPERLSALKESLIENLKAK